MSNQRYRPTVSMEIEMFPKGDGCQCVECRARCGDTQFAEFMERANAFATRVRGKA